MTDANRIRGKDVATGTPGHQPVVQSITVVADTEASGRHLSLRQLVRDSSEFGVPRWRGVARSRTPMTVTEAGTQFFLGPTGVQPYRYLIIPSRARLSCWPVRRWHSFLLQHLITLLCSVPYVLPGTGVASRMAGYCDWRIACGSHGYSCCTIVF